MSLKFKRTSTQPSTPSATNNPAHDFCGLDGLLTPDERAIRDKVRAFAETEIRPIIADYWERDETPFELLPKLAALNLAGGTIKGYGCAGLSAVAAGLVSMELTRGDGSVATLARCHDQVGGDTRRQLYDVFGASAEPEGGDRVAAHLEVLSQRLQGSGESQG